MTDDKQIIKKFHKTFDDIREGDDLYCHYDLVDEKPNLESFILSALQKQRESFVEKIELARAEGAQEAYVSILKILRDAKSKFPNSKEFELVIDVRDIEKSLEAVSKKDTILSEKNVPKREE